VYRHKPAILPLGGPLMIIRQDQASWQQGIKMDLPASRRDPLGVASPVKRPH
jgi:hypothetical protein